MHKRRALQATLLAATLVSASAAAAPTADVDLRIERSFDRGNNIYEFSFTGAISPARAGEYVAILAKPCGAPDAFWTANAGATTGPGGAYRFVTNSPPEYKNLTVWPPAYYRARWKEAHSEAVLLRGELGVRVSRMARLRYRASIAVSSTRPLSLRGRVAELQRLTAGQWTRIRTGRFVVLKRDGFATTFAVTFSAPAQALLRVVVPAESVGACYEPAISKDWRTG